MRPRLKASELSKPAAPATPLPGLLPPEVRGDPVQVGLTLPPVYLRIIEAEAARFGLRRGQFLELLVRRKAGLVHIARSPDSPAYDIEPSELEEREDFLWHLPASAKQLLDQIRTEFAGIAPRSWVLLAINEWIEHPMRFSEPTVPTE